MLALAAPATAEPATIQAAPSDATGASDATAGVTSDDATTAKAKKKKPGPTQPVGGLGGASIDASVGGTFRKGSRGYVLKGALLKVNAVLDGSFTGLPVTITIKRGSKRLSEKSLTLKAKRGKSSASLNYRVRRAGHYTFTVKTEGDGAAVPASKALERVSVVTSKIKRGRHGVAVRVIQDKLDRLGYVVPNGGTFDAATGRALLAFRKVNGMKRVESAGSKVAGKLARNKGGFKLKYRKGRHIEVDISRQVMAFTEGGGKVTRIYHVSTGAGGTPTIRGRYHMYRKDLGTNAKGMVHSNYFIRGYAIHGFASVPTYPASHGCVRVPIPDAMSIYNWVRLGDRIDTYN